MENKISWTKEQEELIDGMVKEAENIGYAQGWDDAMREIIEILKSKLLNRRKLE